eukprot:8429458-Pyramimonas_sp.AAC.1
MHRFPRPKDTFPHAVKALAGWLKRARVGPRPVPLGGAGAACDLIHRARHACRRPGCCLRGGAFRRLWAAVGDTGPDAGPRRHRVGRRQPPVQPARGDRGAEWPRPQTSQEPA